MHYVKTRQEKGKQYTKCGSSHKFGQCPAFGIICKKFNTCKSNHWAKSVEQQAQALCIQENQQKADNHCPKSGNKKAKFDVLEVSLDEETFNINTLVLASHRGYRE